MSVIKTPAEMHASERSDRYYVNNQTGDRENRNDCGSKCQEPSYSARKRRGDG